MKTISKKTSSTVDTYIKEAPKDAHQHLITLRTLIQKEAPDATEVLSYGMPAYKLHGMLVYFAAHTKHVGLYPMPSALIQFEKELTSYVTSKSTIQFPFGKQLPVALIRKILKFRIKENLEKQRSKTAKKSIKK